MFVYPRLPLLLKHQVKEQPGSSSMPKNAKNIELHCSNTFKGVQTNQTNKPNMPCLSSTKCKQENLKNLIMPTAANACSNLKFENFPLGLSPLEIQACPVMPY